MNVEYDRVVTVQDMMAARDARAGRQRAWLDAHGAPLVSLTLNIAGPVKVTPLVARGFVLAVEQVDAQLARHGFRVLAAERFAAFTGLEALWAVQADAQALKRAMVCVEEDGAFGRLLDVDVLGADGEKVGRDAVGIRPRRCLLCAEEAAACARSRAHALEALAVRTETILQDALYGRFADAVAALAQEALLLEVAVTPKPGLVDRCNSGAHDDMDFMTFLKSASVLVPYFRDCARAGLQGGAPRERFEALRYPGMCAQDRMYRATGGVNTHKGAIFSMGILCCAVGLAAAQGKPLEAETLCALCADMTGEALREELRAIKGLPGARGEAAGGFASARLHGLPAYRARRAAGDSVNDAGVCALIALMAVMEDANIARRGGEARAREIREEMRALAQDCTLARVRDADKRLIDERVSPGGCADMLAVVFFLDGADGLQAAAQALVTAYS